MDKEQLIEALRTLDYGDPERAHLDADMLLLAFIDDERVTNAFDAIDKWYA